MCTAGVEDRLVACTPRSAMGASFLFENANSLLLEIDDASKKDNSDQ